jgi:hypothetical protein
MGLYQVVILPVLLHIGYMDIKLGLSHRLRVFDNRVWQKVLGPERQKVIGG